MNGSLLLVVEAPPENQDDRTRVWEALRCEDGNLQVLPPGKNGNVVLTATPSHHRLLTQPFSMIPGQGPLGVG
jgi:hypothetical protein